MKRSATIKLTLLAAAAAFSLGCNTPNGLVQRCIDPSTNKVVSDDNCGNNNHYYYYGGYRYPFYRWYYGGDGYYPGEIVTGGVFDRPSNITVFHVGSPEGGAIIRGGFGHGFSGFSSGE